MNGPSFSFNYPPCAPACPATPGVFQIRVRYFGSQDSGQVFGTFTTREQAEKCLQVLAGRSDVESATIETGV